MSSCPRRSSSNFIANLAGMASLALATTAAVAANLEYAHDYEIAFLDACTANATTPACRCAMEAIQNEMTFQAFAEAVARNGGDLSSVPWWNAIVAEKLARCRGAPARVAGRIAIPTAEAATEGCRDDGELAADLQRAAHIAQ